MLNCIIQFSAIPDRIITIRIRNGLKSVKISLKFNSGLMLLIALLSLIMVLELCILGSRLFVHTSVSQRI